MKISNINYKVKKSKQAKYLRLTIYPDASVVLTVPWWTPKFLYTKFIQSKQGWILEQLKKIKVVKIDNVKKREDYLNNKEKAREIILTRLRELNKFYNYTYKKVAIRDQKTRWGSCSSKGNLNFNYKLLFLDKESLDYIIVHELCHLEEMNHSFRFWALVERVVPEHKRIRRKLKKQVMNF